MAKIFQPKFWRNFQKFGGVLILAKIFKHLVGFNFGDFFYFAKIKPHQIFGVRDTFLGRYIFEKVASSIFFFETRVY